MVLVWSIAAAEAQVGNASEIEPAHLLLGLCKLCDLDFRDLFAEQPAADPALRHELPAQAARIRDLFRQAGLDQTRFRHRLRALVATAGPGVLPGEVVHRSQESRQVFRRAENIAVAEPAIVGPLVWPRHLLQALLEIPNPPWAGLLAELGVREPLGQILGAAGVQEAPPSPALQGKEGQEESGQEPRARRTPLLDHFGRDLTQLAREGKLDPVIGRREEMRALARVLTQKQKSNAILVGEAGVGKTCIVEGLAQRLIAPGAPSALKDKRVVEISMATLVAGTRYRGEFEERMQQLVKEASEVQDIILFIDEIHTVLHAGGGEGAVDAANILKPALTRGDLRCVGATTISDYRKHIERDPALERRFQMVWVDEPTGDEAVEILRGLRPAFEEHHDLRITDEAIEAAVELSVRYLSDFRLPDKAIDLIDQACASGRIATLSPSSHPPTVASIGRSEVAAVVARRCRLPVERLTTDDAARLLRMEEALRKRVVGQDEAVRAVSEAVRTARAGLKDPRKPIGVFLFVGATGTGKTELAKALTEFLFDDEQRLIRIDMSEYMEKHAVSRLIGAPPGYVGHEEEGQLTGPVRSNPCSVVLFDEVEKAHPDVFDIFLQIFDDGRLTDARGRRASFSETVIILTSNLGNRTQAAGRPMGLQLVGSATKEADGEQEAYRRRIMDAVRGALRPELLNRIQRIVFFYPLSQDSVRQIIDKILAGLCERLRGRRIDVRLTEAAYAFLIQEGFHLQFGAREMERTVDWRLVQPLAKALLEGRFGKGARVRVDVCGSELLLEDAEATRPVDLGDWHKESEL